MDELGERDWLLISVSTGKEATLRVHVWRQLRKLGAVYLHQSVCLLPKTSEVQKMVSRLVSRVRAQGGRARVLGIQLGPEEHAELVAEQQADRDNEYAEVVERVPQFLDEIKTELDRGRATYAEVEESEADLERFERWLDAINVRDYFSAPGGAVARSAVQECHLTLKNFEAAALESDTGQNERRGLRVASSPSRR